MIRTILLLTIVASPLYAMRKPASVASSTNSLKRTFSQAEFDFNCLACSSSSEVESDEEGSACDYRKPQQSQPKPLPKAPDQKPQTKLSVTVNFYDDDDDATIPDDDEPATQELNLPSIYDDLPLSSFMGPTADHSHDGVILHEYKGRVYWVNSLTDEIVSINDAEGVPINMAGQARYWANVGVDSDTEEDGELDGEA